MKRVQIVCRPFLKNGVLVRDDGLLQPVVLNFSTTNYRFNYSKMLLRYFHVLNTHIERRAVPLKRVHNLLKSVAMATLVGTRCIWNCTRVQQSWIQSSLVINEVSFMNLIFSCNFSTPEAFKWLVERNCNHQEEILRAASGDRTHHLLSAPSNWAIFLKGPSPPISKFGNSSTLSLKCARAASSVISQKLAISFI